MTGHREKATTKAKILLSVFQALSTEVIMFLLLHAAKIKYLPIQRTYSWKDLDNKFVLFGSEQHF